ncbi:MAG: outer membrane beta-barrel protein [Opitutales bacterium]|nr:outer membrane beta-barrel protein [Opitutales bacterium]
MKKFTLLASALVFGAALNASPLITVGDQVDIFLLGSVKGSWNSNIYNSANKVDDYILTLKVGAEANYGRDSQFKANVKFYELFNRYLGNAVCNNNLANLFANASYTEERWNVAAGFSFQQLGQNSDTLSDEIGNLGIEDIVRYDVYKAFIRGSYDFTDKISGTVGFEWNRYAYQNYTNIYSNRDTFMVPVSVFYAVTEKIQAGLTYQYRTTEYNGGSAASAAEYGSGVDDHYAGLSVRGELLPKLTTEIFLGYAYRDLDNAAGTDDSTFSFSAKFNYLATEKLTAYVRAYREFGNGAARQSAINTGVEVGANYLFSDKISAFAVASYYYSEYMIQNRDDDHYMFSIGATWSPIQNTYVTASYRYIDNASNINGTSYMGNLVSIEAGFKY